MYYIYVIYTYKIYIYIYVIYPDLTSDRCWKHTCFPRDVGLPFTQVVLSDHGEKLIVPRTHAYLPPSHLISDL